MTVRLITTRQELTELARELRVRNDWHEPDEQGLTARVEGFTFDNAGYWPTASVFGGGGNWRTETRGVELHVILSQKTDPGCDECGCQGDVEDVAAINLATLLAWASDESDD